MRVNTLHQAANDERLVGVLEACVSVSLHTRDERHALARHLAMSHGGLQAAIARLERRGAAQRVRGRRCDLLMLAEGCTRCAA